MARRALASLVVAIGALVATGCPGSQNPHQTGGSDGGVDGAMPDAPTCTAVPTCTVTLTYHGAGTSVVLHGDFAADGWTTGVTMTPIAGGFTATVPVTNKQVIVYKFTVDGTWISDPDNTRKSPDGFGGFNSVVRAACDACPPARPMMDWRDGIMYFAMVDRFNNGDPSNDLAVPGAEQPGQFQGGDFVGLKQKIDSGYFDELGVNTIWITSPLDNADQAYLGTDGHNYSSYHGYWPKDESMIETRYGSEAELASMVASAHAHGIQVIADYVMNHVHSESPIYAAHPDWFNPNSNGRGGNCVCGQGCDWNNDRLVCWFDNFLPDLNFLNPAARKWSVDNAIMWAKRAGIDGFRLDAVKHIQTVWLTDLRARAQAELAFDQPFYMVGETFDGDRNLIKSYVDPSVMLNGQFDFPMRGQVLGTLLHRTGVMQDLVGFLDSNAGFYGAGAVMSTFLGNHDVPRAIEHALDTPMFDPWDGGKWAAWSGQPQLPTSRSPFERLTVAYTLLFTLPGIPMIYYGDEYGMPGGGDPDNRRFMQWSNYTADQTWLHDRIATLAKVRRAHPATRRGTRTTLGVTGDVFVYKMDAPGDTVFVALNRGDGQTQAQGLPAGTYTDLVNGGTVTAPVALPPRSALVLVAH